MGNFVNVNSKGLEYVKDFKVYQRFINNLLDTNVIKWKRFDSKQAYISDRALFNANGSYYLFKSYSTIVGIIDELNNTFIELGKYSRTTSKQVTQYINKMGYDRVLIDRGM